MATPSSKAPSPQSTTPRTEGIHHHQHTITKTQLSLDGENDLVFVFNTPSTSFGLVVPLPDPLDLTWKETQAVVDATRLCTPGTCLSPRQFRCALCQLQHKYGTAKGPIAQDDGRVCGAFYPVRREIQSVTHYNRNMLASTMLKIDCDENRLVILSHTCAEDVYAVRMYMGPDGKMCELSCMAFMDVMTVLEPGDILDAHSFEQFSHFLHGRYGSADLTRTQQDGISIITINVKPLFYRPKRPRQHPRQKRHAVPAQPLPISPASTSASSAGSVTSVPASPGGTIQLNPLGEICMYEGFTYVRKIAESGQAKVFSCTRNSDGFPVAIKVFRVDKDSTEVYKSELKLLLKMGAHPNVVSVLNYFESPSPALVMPLVNGSELGRYVRTVGGLSQYEGLKIARGIAHGLNHLHSHGIVHRDLKSSNVLVNGDGVPIIIDLGLSSIIPAHNNDKAVAMDNITREVKGTCLWMTPEMILRREWSDRTDVYAFGMMLWELFSGRSPFAAMITPRTTQMEMMFEIAKGKRPSIEEISGAVDKRICALIEACWNQKVEKRPSMKMVLEILGGDDAKAVFQKFDENKDGRLQFTRLQFTEFVLFMKQYAAGRVSPMQMGRLFEAMDESKCDAVSYEEFEGFWRQIELGLKVWRLAGGGGMGGRSGNGGGGPGLAEASPLGSGGGGGLDMNRSFSDVLESL